MYIRNKYMQKTRKRYYILEERVKKKERYKTINVRYLGTADKLLADLEELDKFRGKKP